MARRKTIKPIDLSAAIQEILTQYGDDVYDVLGKAVEEVSQEAVRKLQAVNVFGGTGAYVKDWVADDVPKGRLTKAKVVHNEDHYRLAHLLEKGHVSANGTGRNYNTDKAPVKGRAHIKPVEEWAQKELPRKVEEMIRTI